MLYGAIAASELKPAYVPVSLAGSANFVGAGNLSATGYLYNPIIQASANFVGAGAMSASLRNPIIQGNVNFVGAGQMVVNTLQPLIALSKTLTVDKSLAAGSSFRQQIIPPLAYAGRPVRITFKAGSNSFACDNCSMWFEQSTYTTSGPPAELLFTGSSGFSISSGQSITSDWLDIGYTINTDSYLIIIGDVGAASVAAYINTGVTGFNFWTQASSDSYNVASPGGSWTLTGNSCLVEKIEVMG